MMTNVVKRVTEVRSECWGCGRWMIFVDDEKRGGKIAIGLKTLSSVVSEPIATVEKW